MSFTCPDCLWTSHHPQDVQNNYCGHCHKFKEFNFAPTSFQREAIRALLHPFDDPQAALCRVVVLFRIQLMTLSAIYIELSQMMTAADITAEQRRALSIVINTVDRVKAERHPRTDDDR